MVLTSALKWIQVFSPQDRSGKNQGSEINKALQGKGTDAAFALPCFCACSVVTELDLFLLTCFGLPFRLQYSASTFPRWRETDPWLVFLGN